MSVIVFRFPDELGYPVVRLIPRDEIRGITFAKFGDDNGERAEPICLEVEVTHSPAALVCIPPRWMDRSLG